MHNPVKGQGVEIEISGSLYPLVFSYDAIAKIETKYDQTIGEVQTQMPRVVVMLDLLAASLVGFDDGLQDAEIPPLIETQMLIQKALHIAYFGVKETDELEKDDTKKKQK